MRLSVHFLDELLLHVGLLNYNGALECIKHRNLLYITTMLVDDILQNVSEEKG